MPAVVAPSPPSTEGHHRYRITFGMSAELREHREAKQRSLTENEMLEQLLCTQAVVTLTRMKACIDERAQNRWSLGGLDVRSVWSHVWRMRVRNSIERARAIVGVVGRRELAIMWQEGKYLHKLGPCLSIGAAPLILLFSVQTFICSLVFIMTALPVILTLAALTLALEWLTRILLIVLAAEPSQLIKAALCMNPYPLLAHRQLVRVLHAGVLASSSRRKGIEMSPRAIANAFEAHAAAYEQYTLLAFRGEVWFQLVNALVHVAVITIALISRSTSSPDPASTFASPPIEAHSMNQPPPSSPPGSPPEQRSAGQGSMFSMFSADERIALLVPVSIALEMALLAPGLLRLFTVPTPARIRDAISRLDIFYVSVMGGARVGMSAAVGEFVAAERKRHGEGGSYVTRFTGVRMISGNPAKAALGINAWLGVDDRTLWHGMSTGMDGLLAEWAEHGTDEDKECLEYILRQPVGSNSRRWPHSGERIMDEFDPDAPSRDERAGQTFEFFVAHPKSKEAGLLAEHVLCLRLYTTAAFRSINEPLRGHGVHASKPHPLPLTVAYLDDGIKRLRAVNKPDHEADTPTVSLYRGMRNLELPAEFRERGGTELAPMSTTLDLRVALDYSDKAEKRLLFKVLTSSFIDRGADLSFLSAFPQEVEILYPPLTLLLPTGREDTIAVGGIEYCVVEVEPRFAS